MSMTVTLNKTEVTELKRPTEGEGGFQSLLEKLQVQLDSNTSMLRLENGDLERIPRYAFDYGNGGWEDRLKRIFSRTLGPRLGRDA